MAKEQMAFGKGTEASPKLFLSMPRHLGFSDLNGNRPNFDQILTFFSRFVVSSPENELCVRSDPRDVGGRTARDHATQKELTAQLKCGGY